MGKKKLTPAEAGKGTKTLATYFSVLVKPDENKNEEKPLKNANIAGFLAKSNDNTKDNMSVVRRKFAIHHYTFQIFYLHNSNHLLILNHRTITLCYLLLYPKQLKLD